MTFILIRVIYILWGKNICTFFWTCNKIELCISKEVFKSFCFWLSLNLSTISWNLLTHWTWGIYTSNIKAPDWTDSVFTHEHAWKLASGWAELSNSTGAHTSPDEQRLKHLEQVSWPLEAQGYRETSVKSLWGSALKLDQSVKCY